MNMRFMCWALSALFLGGCEQHYRYPCQNPANWNKPECQKPLCEVNQDCPEHIFSGTKVELQPKEAKVECK